MARYTTAPGRVILKDGEPFAAVTTTFIEESVGPGKTPPTDADNMARAIPMLVEALQFYRGVCGISGVMLTRENAEEAYKLAGAALNELEGKR